MKLNKKLMVLAAVGALGAASATSAHAFENEFHGFYNLKYFLSNYETSSFGFLTPGGQSITSTTTLATGVTTNRLNLGPENRKASNFFDQRARIFYTAKANDDLKLVTGFEIDSVFGDKAQGQALRNQGGALESDATNLETKWVYLDFKIPSTPVKVTAGIQPAKDAFKGIFLDADIAGINTVTKLGPTTIGVGYFRAYDQSFFSTTRTDRGIDDLDIVAVSADFNINKNAKVGAAYYLYDDNRNNIDNNTTTPFQTPLTLHVFGVNADVKLGDLGLSGFAAMQQGSVHSQRSGRATISGYAFNAAAKLPVGPGTLRSAFLYASGDDGRDGIITSWQSVTQTQNGAVGAPANTYNESNMMLLNRAAGMEGTQSDVNIVNSINNRNQGVILATLGYDAQITPKCYANANVGVAWAAKNNAGGTTTLGTVAAGATTRTDTTVLNRAINSNGQANGTNFLGTEINIETGYKLYDNLTAKLQAAYVILGGYYAGTAVNGKDPEDPYTARVMLSYVF
jgi:hypothetical protein